MMTPLQLVNHFITAASLAINKWPLLSSLFKHNFDSKRVTNGKTLDAESRKENMDVDVVTYQVHRIKRVGVKEVTRSFCPQIVTISSTNSPLRPRDLSTESQVSTLHTLRINMFWKCERLSSQRNGLEVLWFFWFTVVLSGTNAKNNTQAYVCGKAWEHLTSISNHMLRKGCVSCV